MICDFGEFGDFRSESGQLAETGSIQPSSSTCHGGFAASLNDASSCSTFQFRSYNKPVGIYFLLCNYLRAEDFSIPAHALKLHKGDTLVGSTV